MGYQTNPLVDEYIAQFSPEVQHKLQQLRRAIQDAFPKTVEDISYGMPTYRPAPAKRGIVHFANFEKHIGLYAVFMPDENSALAEGLKQYNTGKGTLQFKHGSPLPIGIIREALAFHAAKF